MRIDLVSTTDPYLFLLQGAGRDGTVLARNDDSDGLNSRISRSLSAGTYTVEATTYSSGAMGSFTLTLQAGSGTTPTNTPTPTPTLDRGSVPATPSGLSGQLIATGTVSLDWNDAANVESYEVRFLRDNRFVQLSDEGPVNSVSISFVGSSATMSGLPDGYVRYIFLLRARNAAGTSPWSATVTNAE